MLRITIILFVTQLLVNTAVGQFSAAKLKEQLALEVQRFDGEDGLSQGLVTSIAEDSLGYLWLGTKDGLNRYDGKDFRVFRHDESDSTSIPGNYITTVVLDADNRIWVATRNGGICTFNPESERFLRYNDSLAIGNGTVDKLIVLPEGGVVRTTVNEEIQTFNYSETDNGSRINYIASKNLTAIENDIQERLPDHGRKPLYEIDAGGNLWVNLLEEIVLYKDFIHLGMSSVRVFENETKYQNKPLYSSILEDPNTGEIYWYKDLMAGKIWKYNDQIQDFEPFIELPERHVYHHVKFVDSKSRLWSWTPEGNLLQVDLNDNSYVLYEVEWSRKTESLPYSVRWYEDRNGNIWMGTDGYGLFKISAVALSFKRFPNQVKGIENNTQTMRAANPDDHALYNSHIKKKWNEFIARIKLQSDEQKLELQLQFLYVDDNGSFLILAHSNKRRISNIIRVDTSNYSIETLVSKPYLAEYWAHPLILDSEKTAWCPEKYGENGHYMFRLDLETNRVDSFKIPIECMWHEYAFVSDWHEDKLNRKMWFGTTCGLFCFDKNNESWTTYTHINGDSTSLSSDMVLSILPDPYGPTEKLWVGTEGSGLNALDVKTGKFKRYTTANSDLPNDVINGVLADEHQYLWISTNNGLCQFDPRSEEMQNYFRQDGISNNEFNRYEYSKAKNGELYFGGMGGWMHFNPSDFQPKQEPSELVLTGLKLWNNPVSLDNPLNETDGITLGHKENMVTIDFALLDLTAPHRNKYKYHMQGLSDNWIDLKNATEATFTNLDPGNYTFQVMGCNSSGVWTEQPTELSITILPPWYATWWFRLIMFLSLAAMLYGFYRFRLAHMLKLERTRNRIAQDLHDEIGSTISSISLFGTVLKNTMRENPDKADKIIDRINTYSSRIGERMNDLVWSIKADNDDFDQVVSRMRAYASAMAESKGIELDFKVEAKVRTLSLDMDVRKNIYLIFKEAVNNAVKYSECSILVTSMQIKGRQLELNVKDNGKGFDLEEVMAYKSAFGGNGLSGMKIRAKELKANLQIDAVPQQGTEIRLTLKV